MKKIGDMSQIVCTYSSLELIKSIFIVLTVITTTPVSDSLKHPLNRYFFGSSWSMSFQGQAIGYGRITQFCPLPFWGHYFHMVTQANSMDRISSTRYQMKDMNMIFPLIPQNPILVEWFSHSGWSKLGGF